MKKLLLILGTLFAVGCVAEMADEDEGVEEVGVKQQALGTACPARVYTMLTTPDSRFNSSGWEGEWSNYGDGSFWGIRVCDYNKYSTMYAGFKVNKNCSAVPFTNGQGWLCSGGPVPERINCPDTASVGAISSYRQSATGTKVWGTPGPLGSITPSTGSYLKGSGSFDSTNQRIWCGYTMATTFTFTRPESY